MAYLYDKIYCYNFSKLYIKINLFYLIIIITYFNINFKIFWGLGIGDWGLGIGDWGLGPIPNPQSPIPNPPPP